MSDFLGLLGLALTGRPASWCLSTHTDCTAYSTVSAAPKARCKWLMTCDNLYSSIVCAAIENEARKQGLEQNA
jgi:hypothetical protein